MMRRILRRSLALLLAAALLAGMFPLALAADEREVVPLKDVYAGRFMIGTVMNPNDSGAKLDFIRYHFNALTPENNTKPNNIWNRPTGNPNFTQADNMISARKADGFYTVGHALAWHNQSDNWPTPCQTYEEARTQLERYISTIAGHYHENENVRLDAWDVVNEAMRDNPENPTDWRNALRHGDLPIERPAKWYAAYANGGNGWDYVYDAFLFARKYAPNATLNYNDFNDEEIPSKAIAIASMVTELNQRYAEEHPEDPRKLIESIGIQGHYSTRLNLDNLEQVLKIYAATGCRICVTELDVQYNGTVGRTLTEEQQKVQAKVYAGLFRLYKKYDKFIDRVTWWGTDDNSNWRSSQRPMIFDVNREPKEAYWAVINPEGYLGLGKEAPRLDAIRFGGQDLDCSMYDVDVSIPKEVSEVAFSAENVVHDYDPSQVKVTVTMEDNRVPCTAKVKIAWADTPESYNEYTVNFGHMTAEWLNDMNYPDTGYRSSVRIRFSDGVSKLQLRQSFEGESGILNTLQEIDPPAKNGSGVYSVRTPEQLDQEFLDKVTLKKSLLDPAGENLIPARISDFSAPERYYRLADSIEPGKTYIIVSSATGKAFTHKALQPVPAGGALTDSKAGYEATPVTVKDDIIVGPELIQDNIRFIFLPRESPDAGSYSGGFNLLSLVHGGLIQPFIIWREDVSTPTAGLYSNATIGDADLDRAVWYNTGFDPVTHETTLFLHSASKGLTYVLTGNENGFAAQGGSGSIDEYKSLGRVKLYEYVETFREDTGCEHEYEAVLTPPTCTEEGYTTHTCTKCGDKYIDERIEALGHDWDEGKVTKEPTETASGVMTYTCRRCGETRTERIPRTGTGGWTLAETVEAGKQYVIVSNGYALTNQVAQVSTAYGNTSLGSTPVTVDDGLIVSEVSDEMIWDFAAGTSAVAGEFTTGYFLTNGDSKYLSRNGPTNGNPAPLNTQTYDAENVATKPQYCYWIVSNLDEKGNKAVFLAANGEWSFALRGSAEGFDAPGNADTGTVSAANPVQLYAYSGTKPCEHDYKTVVTAPTCTEKGYTTYTCVKCGESYVDDEVAALGHSFGDWAVSKDATCTEKGEETRTCSRCGEKEARETDALGHDYKSNNPEPTCAHFVTVIYTCTRCGDRFEGEELAPMPHDFKEEITAPTCTEKGFTTYTCARCGYTYRDDEVPALGHSFGDWAVSKAATCTEMGEETRICSGCGEKETRETDALGHDFKDGKCTRCGAVDPSYVDCSALNAAIESAEKVQTDKFTDESVAALEKALEAARTALKADKQADADAAAEALLTAIKGLVEKAPFRFDDVQDESQYFFDPVYWAVDKEITTGTTQTTFSPNKGCTRAQVVTFLWRAAGRPMPKTEKNPFTDVSADAYYYNAVLWAVEENITKGTSDTTFRPDQTCTRGQIVTFLCRRSGEPEPETAENPFEDVREGEYYYNAVLWAVENGITTGTSKTAFRPNSTCTRGQIVTFLYRYLGDQ